MLKAVVVDNRLDRGLRIKRLLNSTFINVRIMSVCKNGSEAVVSISVHKPDFIFLDVSFDKELDLIRLQGFSVPVVYTSANPIIAKALHAAGLTCISSPIRIASLRRAVRAIRLQVEERHLAWMRTNHEEDSNAKLAFPFVDRLEFINPNDVLLCKAGVKGKTLVQLSNGQSFYSKCSLTECEELLEDYSFMRISDQCIVNLYSIPDFRLYSKKREAIEKATKVTNS